MLPKNRPFVPYSDSVLYKSIADFATHHGLEMSAALKRELAAFALQVEIQFEFDLKGAMATPERFIIENDRIISLSEIPKYRFKHRLSEEGFRALHYRNAQT